MTATAIIEQAAADGVRLWPNGDRLAYEGPSGAVARWKPILAASKPEILATLSLACTPETPQIDNGGCDARKATATASRWWLIHYPDREPVEVASFPPATHAEILERHQDAIAAEPINQAFCKPFTLFSAHPDVVAAVPINQAAAVDPLRACSTCTHVTGRGGCGEPVAAGLSDVVGVIRYSPDGGADCPAWVATIAGDLETRIRTMAERWAYSGDDLAAAMAGARSDPAGWLAIVVGDEASHGLLAWVAQ